MSQERATPTGVALSFMLLAQCDRGVPVEEGQRRTVPRR